MRHMSVMYISFPLLLVSEYWIMAASSGAVVPSPCCQACSAMKQICWRYRNEEKALHTAYSWIELRLQTSRFIGVVRVIIYLIHVKAWWRFLFLRKRKNTAKFRIWPFLPGVHWWAGVDTSSSALMVICIFWKTSLILYFNHLQSLSSSAEDFSEEELNLPTLWCYLKYSGLSWSQWVIVFISSQEIITV